MTDVSIKKDSQRSTMSLRQWLAVLTVAAGTFIVVTVENIPTGLLTAIGNDLRVADSTVALMVTASGLVAAVAAPTLPLLIRRLDRKSVLITLLFIMALANVLTALASNITLMLIARLLAGVSIGGFWALAAGLAVRLVPSAHVGKATSLIFLGAMVASVLGLPATTLLGSTTSWQMAFLATSGFGMLLVAAIFAWVPKMPAAKPVQLQTMLQQLGNKDVRNGIITTFLLVWGHFSAFVFISPLLQDFAHVDARAIGPLLFFFGGAAIVGNQAAGVLAGRNVRKAIIVVSLLLGMCLLALPLVGSGLMGVIPLFIAWGFTFGCLPVAVQTWVFKKAPHIEAATSLNTAMFNAAIAFGALYGGLATKFVGLPHAVWMAAIPVAFAAIVMARTPKGSRNVAEGEPLRVGREADS